MVLIPFGQCIKVCVLHDWSETIRIFYNLFFQTSDEECGIRKSLLNVKRDTILVFDVMLF